MPLQIPSPRSKKHARIEIIPLIDIVFFLLATFVMVSMSMVKNKGIPVHLPVASSGTPQERKEFTTITITATGEVYFDKQPINMEELDGALKGLLAANPEPRVFINGDAKAEFGKAIEVLDRVRKLGITKIAIETKPPAPSASVPGATAPATAPAGTPVPTATPAETPAAVPAPAPIKTPPAPAPAPATPGQP
jgi:biopolymer transport protein ExbD